MFQTNPLTRCFGKPLENLLPSTPIVPCKLISSFSLKPPQRKVLPDPQTVPQYADDIFEYLLKKKSPITNPQYMRSKQKDINVKMRAILIDWLISVHVKFALIPRTLFLAISILDRYLERVPIARQKLQLVGICCLLMASKIEEVYYPQVQDFAEISDNSITKKEIIEMEGCIVSRLGFEFSEACTLDFFEYFSGKLAFNEKMKEFGMYILELCLVEYETLNYKSSLLSGSTIYLALKVFSRKIDADWENFIMMKCGFSMEEVRECVKQLWFMGKNQEKSRLNSVAKKHMDLLKEFTQKLNDVAL